MGRKTDEWLKAREKLKKIYFNKGITVCEIKTPVCWRNNTLAFAHRYKRNDPRCRHTFKQTLLACTPCHMKIENDRELTDSLFKALR